VFHFKTKTVYNFRTYVTIYDRLSAQTFTFPGFTRQYRVNVMKVNQ